MGTPNEDLTDTLKRMIDAAEKRMAEMCGMQLYKNPENPTLELRAQFSSAYALESHHREMAGYIREFLK